MKYKQTLEYLYNKLPMFSRIGEKAIKKNLDNTIKLCTFLGNPQQQIKSIHIAGTNGKGSTAHGLASIFQAAGYKTGLYTSPHIVDFRERIKIDGKMCSKQYIIDTTKKLKPLIEAIQPSFFEITVAFAFHYFAKQKVDIAIIETGLGGRLDSTNVIIPEISVITNISFDHQHLLGNTLGAIAKEKAGIIKQNIPVVIGRSNKITDKIFIDTANNKNASIDFSNDIIQIKNCYTKNKYQKIEYSINNKNKSIETDLLGQYQIENIKTILSTIHIYNNINNNRIKQKYIKKGLKNAYSNTNLMARWQYISKNPKTIVDVGHNEDGIKKIIEQLAQEKYNNLHIIYGAVKDKDVDKILQLLPKNANYYFTEASIERKLDVEILYQKAMKHQLKGNIYHQPKIALKNANKNANKNDLILIIGSFFILEDILKKKN